MQWQFAVRGRGKPAALADGLLSAAATAGVNALPRKQELLRRVAVGGDAVHHDDLDFLLVTPAPRFVSTNCLQHCCN
eukprot:SAG31_NODE_4198_length_3481_cov_21.063868_3_plen_77_part_00